MNTAIDAMLWIIYLVFLYFNVFWLLVYFVKDNTENKRKLRRIPKVTIAIPVYNEEKVIELTLKSAINLDYPRDKYEILVINNKSTDNTVKIAEKIRKEFQDTDIQIINITRKGKGLALNKALEMAHGEYFVLFDADSVVDSDALKKLLPYFKQKKVACVLPMMKVQKPKNFLQKMQSYEYIMNIFYKKLMGHLDCVHVAPGPFSIYKTRILRKLGGFSHPNLTEDLEMTLRLQKNHYKIIQTTEAEVTTIVPDNMKELYSQRNRWYKGSVFNALSKDYRGMWFNKKYGDFGFIQMPVIVIPGIFVVFIFLVHGSNLIKNVYKTFFNLYSIDFDILTLISNFSLNFNFLDGNYTKSLVSILMLCTALLTFILSHRLTREEVSQHGKIPLLTFLFIFPFFLAYVWGTIFTEIIFKKVQEW